MSADATIEFVMDDAYFREFHAEWVAAVGKGWRVDVLMSRVFAGAALVTAAAALVAGRREFLLLAALLAGIAGFETWKRARRRNAWFAHCRTLPWFGRTMRIELRGGELVQVNDYAGDPRFERTGEIRSTPRGYLVRYRSAGIPVPNGAVSPELGSVYAPHRAVRPAMTREEFLGRLVIRGA